MQTGVIAKKTDRGYGFISRDGEEKDLFFHANELQGISFDDIQEGATVTFEVTQGVKGDQAVNVSPAQGAQAANDDDASASDDVAEAA